MPAAGDLRGDVLHVPGRQELALLDVDRAAGLRRGDQQVGLPAQEGRDLQHVDRLGDRRALLGRVHVGQHRHAEALAHLGEDRQALLHAEAARGVGAGAVRLVEAGLVDEADAELARELGQRAGTSPARARGFRAGTGPAISANGRSLPIVDIADLDVARLGHAPPPYTSRACVDRRADEATRTADAARTARLQLRMELHADEPGMVGDLDDLRQHAVGRHAGEPQPAALQPLLVVDVHLVAVAVALADRGRAVDLARPALPGCSTRLVGAEPHRAAEIAAGLARLQLVAAHPFGHQADHRLRARAELGRAGALHAGQIARRLDHRHLHAEADAEKRHLALAREARRLDLALRAALAEAAGHQDAVHAFQMLDRVLALEDLGVDPVELDPHIVGDAAMASAPRPAICRRRAAWCTCRRWRS